MKIAFTSDGAMLGRTVLAKYLQFCLVGLSGLVIDMGVIFLLTAPTALGWNLTLGKIIAAEFAVLNNFFWNELWTFRGVGENTWKNRLCRFAKFNLICVGGLGLSVLLLNVQVWGFGTNVYMANFISIVLASIWNFGMNFKFGWKKPAVAIVPSSAGSPDIEQAR